MERCRSSRQIRSGGRYRDCSRGVRPPSAFFEVGSPADGRPNSEGAPVLCMLSPTATNLLLVRANSSASSIDTIALRPLYILPAPQKTVALDKRFEHHQTQNGICQQQLPAFCSPSGREPTYQMHFVPNKFLAEFRVFLNIQGCLQNTRFGFPSGQVSYHSVYELPLSAISYLHWEADHG